MNQKNDLYKDRTEQERENRKLLLKSYIDRLSQGESLEIVRKDSLKTLRPLKHQKSL